MLRTALIAAIVALCAAGPAQAPPLASGSPSQSSDLAAQLHDPIARLQADNDALAKRVAALETRAAAQDATIAELESHPSGMRLSGYSHAFTTKDNWNGIPGDAVVEYWPRD